MTEDDLIESKAIAATLSLEEVRKVRVKTSPAFGFSVY
jgi:hypothetical protein